MKLLENDGEIYTSNDFKKGIETPLLVNHADWLKLLIELDTRGGIFGQEDMSAALRHIFAQNATFRGAAVRAAAVLGRTKVLFWGGWGEMLSRVFSIGLMLGLF